MIFDNYSSLLKRTQAEKAADFQRDGRLNHLINAGQLNVQLLDEFRQMADRIRQLSRSRQGINALRQLLSHRRAMLYFTQPSTRTFLSFTAACQIVGLTCNEVRDASTSSEVKRESPVDSIRMFSSYFDVIIMRSPLANFAECCAYLMNQLMDLGKRWVPIINGGSGADEHPTQALLDVYTIQRTFDFAAPVGRTAERWDAFRQAYPHLVAGPAHKTYCFCGDIGRGRTVRSLASVLAQYEGVRMFFVAPPVPSLRLGDDLHQRLAQQGIEVHQFDSLDAKFEGRPLLEQIDCLYMTRIQREHNSADDEESLRNADLSQFQLTPQRAVRLRPYAPILHPFPRDSHVQEIPTEIDTDPRAMYFRQARNGMWARAALLVHIFGAHQELAEIYDSSMRDQASG